MHQQHVFIDALYLLVFFGFTCDLDHMSHTFFYKGYSTPKSRHYELGNHSYETKLGISNTSSNSLTHPLNNISFSFSQSFQQTDKQKKASQILFLILLMKPLKFMQSKMPPPLLICLIVKWKFNNSRVVINYYGGVINYSWTKLTYRLKINNFVVGMTSYAFAITGYQCYDFDF